MLQSIRLDEHAIDQLDQVARLLCHLSDTSVCLQQASWSQSGMQRDAHQVYQQAVSFMETLNQDPRWYRLVDDALELPGISPDGRLVGQLMRHEWDRHKQQGTYPSYARWFLADKFLTDPSQLLQFLWQGERRTPQRMPSGGINKSFLEVVNEIIQVWHLRLAPIEPFKQAKRFTLHCKNEQLGEIIVDQHHVQQPFCLLLEERQAFISCPRRLPNSKLAHEFGHALHGLLWSGSHFQLQGTRGPWDLIEWPSMLLEELYALKTGEPAPCLSEQIAMAEYDFQYHDRTGANVHSRRDYGSGYYVYPLGILLARRLIEDPQRLAGFAPQVMAQGGRLNPRDTISSLLAK